jgi:nitrite reductase (NO-forming)
MKDQTFYNTVAVAAAAIVVLSFLAGVYGSGFGHGGTSTGSGPSYPHSGDMAFTLRAYLSGFVGVGGTIDGLTDPAIYVLWGTTVTITLVDGEEMEHSLTVGGYDVTTPYVSYINDSASLTFQATVEGAFEYYCPIPGHAAAGMKGTMIVGNRSGTPIGPEVPRTTGRIAADPTALPPPIGRSTPATVNVSLHAVPETAEIEPGVSYTYWTYNGTVPGPFLRVRAGDTVAVTLTNDRNSSANRSVEFPAFLGPHGGVAIANATPGGQGTVTFTATVPGLYLYESGPPNAPEGVANGMFGLLLVQPTVGLPSVGEELYLMESALYLHWPAHTPGGQVFNGTALLDDEPAYEVFNGAYGAFTGSNALSVPVNTTFRLFVGNAGPTDFASLQLLGGTFNETYLNGDLSDPPANGLATVPIAPGGTAVIDCTITRAGTYTLEDSQLVHGTELGASVTIDVPP